MLLVILCKFSGGRVKTDTQAVNSVVEGLRHTQAVGQDSNL